MTDFLVGGYGADVDDGTGVGISWARSHADGRFEVVGLAAETPSPSWITVDGDRVFAALEGSGEVAAFSVSRAASTLAPRGTASSGGSLPCSLAVAGDELLIANFLTGEVAVQSIGSGDVLLAGPPAQVFAGAGGGPAAMQDAPHAHSVLVVGDHALSVDLGSDRVYVHDWQDGALVRTDELPLAPGSGPRDLLALPDGRVAVLTQISCELVLLEPMGSTYEIVQVLALPGATPVEDAAAALGLSVDGRHLYAGIRGSDRIAVIGLDADTAYAIGWVPCGGAHPRHLVVDGAVVHVCNQKSSTVTTFAIGDDGMLTSTGGPVSVPSPTCLAAL
ncbi:lactonase family protein [soil metagenome]